MPKSFDLPSDVRFVDPNLPGASLPESPDTGDQNRQGSEHQDDLDRILHIWADQSIAADPWNLSHLASHPNGWARQTQPSVVTVDEQYNTSTRDYSNRSLLEVSGQHSTMPLDNEPSPEATPKNPDVAPPHPSHARVATSAVERLAHQSSACSGMQGPAALPKSPIELLSALETAESQQRDTAQQQRSTTATTEAAEPESSQMAAAPAAKLWHQVAAQTVIVPSREEGEDGLRYHLQAFQIGCPADDTLSGICSQDIEDSSAGNQTMSMAGTVLQDFADLDADLRFKDL